MIESVMIFALGFFVALLLAILAIPAISARAARLARRRLQAQLPVSLDEITAERDHLRAEFAVAARRLERRNETLLDEKSEALGQVGRQQASLNSLEAELGATKTQLTQVRGEAADLKEDLTGTRDRLAQTAADLDDTRRSLNVRELATDRLEAENRQARNTVESQRIVIAELETKIGSLEANLASDAQVFARLTRDLAVQKDLNAELDRGRANDQKLRTALGEQIVSLERLRDDQGDRIVALEKAERELARRLTDSSVAATRHTETLKANAVRLATLTGELDRLKTSQKLDGEAAKTSLRSATDSVEMLRAEKSSLEGSLEQAREDRLKLQRELTHIKRELAEHIKAQTRSRSAGLGASNDDGTAAAASANDRDGSDEVVVLRAERTRLQHEIAQLKRDLGTDPLELEASNIALRQRIEQVADAIMHRSPAKPAAARQRSSRARSAQADR